MKRYGLLGGKLGHSLSPQIHKLFFHHTGISGSYDILETETAVLPVRIEQLRREYAGCNVTIPHKLDVMPFLDNVAPEAAAIGAVNTIKFTAEGAYGYNTDYFGFGRMLEHNGVEAAGKSAAVLGTGGAARAVVKYLADAGAAQLYLVTRSVQSADQSFAKLFSKLQIIDYRQLEQLQGDILINCTPVGMYPKTAASPVAAAVSSSFAVSVDLIYNPWQTLFLQQAKEAGCKYINGLFMLVAQAVAAQEIWQGEAYDSSLILWIMQELEQRL